MTRAIHGRFLKEDSGAISDHLRNHVHLTNCIHLKNHMHRQSPILAERSLMRDLIALQRTRSLRDPSTSPPSWRSPSILDALSKKYEREAELRDGRRRSVGHDHRREARRFSGSSGPAGSAATSKVAAAEVLRLNDGGTVTSGRTSTSKVRDIEGEGLEKSNRKGSRHSRSGGIEEASFQDSHNSAPVNDVIQGKTEAKDMRSSPKGKTSHNFHPKSLSEQLNGISLDNDDLHTSHFHFHGQRQEKSSEKPEASVRGHHKKPTRFKKRKLRGAKGARPSLGLRESEAHNEASVDSNSLAQGSRQHKHYSEGGDTENIGQDATRDPQNGCGIPWNWSRIHHRGKTFLDIAGRSLSCGLSESRLRKEGSMSHGGLDVPDTSYNSGSSHKSDAEATPLLVESLGSQESTDRAAWVHEYSGELGIFADHRVKHNVDSDLASEARSGERQKLRKYHQGRHLSLTQKYMPRTFRDLVGQNLAVQALSNAVSRRKVGFLYVFHGPHGTGKTSCARVFARALNCLSLEHPKPCGVCSPCVSHDLGKSRSIKEVGPVGNFDFENVMDLLDNMNVSQLQSQYRVFIVDDCDALPPHSWSAISKVIDRSPRRVVFVLISTSLDNLPHIIISRCQKFFFSKLKDADIIYTLQWIAAKEDLQIDKDALKLIASRSDGSLRDAEMTLEQLSLLGQRISVPLVQELVGLISDEKLVDLLDLALSADTVNTVKNLRDIMEAGGEPLALMSQLATVITDILAGSYVFTEARLRRKFFRQTTCVWSFNQSLGPTGKVSRSIKSIDHALSMSALSMVSSNQVNCVSKDDMEKLRQALRTLSEAEKQLRASNDKLTWLTAALLQLAPDQQYLLPSSSTETSFNHSPFTFGNTNGRDTSVRGTSEHPQMPNTERGLLASGGKKHMTTDIIRAGGESSTGKRHKEIAKIWFAVLENIQSSSLKQFMYQEAKLVSVSFGAAQTIQLIFSSQMTKSMAEKYREHIVKAFEYVLGSPLTIEIRCESRPDDVRGNQVPLSDSVPSRVNANQVHASDNRTPNRGYKTKPLKGDVLSPVNQMPADLMGTKNSEIIELAPSPGDLEHKRKIKGKVVESNWVDEPTTSHTERRKIEQPQSQSIVRSKVSLAHVIQQAEGTQRNGWSRRKAMSIAEKLEQENMRLEPRSRSLLCWKGSRRSTRGKLSRLRVRTRRPRSLVKFFPCGRCVTKSPRVAGNLALHIHGENPVGKLSVFSSPRELLIRSH